MIPHQPLFSIAPKPFYAIDIYLTIGKPLTIIYPLMSKSYTHKIALPHAFITLNFYPNDDASAGYGTINEN